MAIAHITTDDTGVSTRGSINQAIDKANLVDGKADQTAVTAETNARNAAVANLQGQVNLRATTVELGSAVVALQQETQERQEAVQAEELARAAADAIRARFTEFAEAPPRPGVSGRFYSHALVGSPSSLSPIDPGIKVSSPDGEVVRVNGSAVVAPIIARRVEPGRFYTARFVFRRTENSNDPSNDGIRLALQWLKADWTALSATALADLVDVEEANGRLVYGFNFSTLDGDDLDAVAPAGAVYVRPYIQTFGAAGATDLEVIEIIDMTNSLDFSPDVSVYSRQVAAFQQLVEEFETRTSVIADNFTASRNANWFTSGTLNDARLSSNVMLRGAQQTVTGAKIFEAPLRMRDGLVIGDGEVGDGGSALIVGDGVRFSITPSDGAGGYDTLRELSFNRDGTGMWTAEGGVYDWVSPPVSAVATGKAGQRAFDGNYLYICIAANSWRRIAHTTW